jgi:Tfp pilus assembly protein PilF
MSAKNTRWRLDVRFTAIFFGVAVATCAILYFWHGRQVAKSTELLLERAQAQESSEEWGELVGTLRRYLQAVPDDDKAWGMLANAEVRRAQSPDDKGSAARVVSRVLARPGIADNVALRLDLARLRYESNGSLDAIAEANRVIKEGNEEQVREATIIEALASHDATASQATGERPWDDIRVKLEKALSLSPSLDDDIALSARLAQLYRNEEIALAAEAGTDEERKGRAEELLDSLVARHANEPQVYLTRYQLRLNDDPEAAQEDLDSAVAHAKADSIDVWLAVGNGTLRNARGEAAAIERARDYFTKAIAADPEDRRGYLGLARALLVLEDAAPNGASIAAAETALKQGLEKTDENDFELRLWLARIYLVTKQEAKFDQAFKALEAAQAARQLGWPSALRMLAQAEVERLEAEQLMSRSQYARAAEQLDALTKLEQRIPAGVVSEVNWAGGPVRTWSMLGQCRESLGEADRAARAYEQAIALSPQTEYYRAAARAWLAAKRRDLAAPYLERVRETDAASNVIPQLQALILGQSRTPAAERDWTEIDKQLAELKKDDLKRFQATLMEAQVLVAKNQLDAAKATLLAAESAPPHTPEEWRALIAALSSIGADADANRCLEKYAAVASKSDAALLQSDLWVLKQQPAAAEAVLVRARDAAPEAEKYTLNLALARLLVGQSRFAEANAVLEKAGKGEGVLYRQALRLQAEIALSAKDWATMENISDEFDKLDGANGTEAKYLDARRLLGMSGDDQSLIKQAEEVTAELVKLRPDWLEAVELQALVAVANKQHDASLRAYERALELSTGTVAESRLGSRYVELVMNALGPVDPLPAGVESRILSSKMLATSAISRAVAQDNIPLAMSLSGKAATNWSSDPQILYWHGQVCALAGRTEEAARVLAQAARLAPNSPIVWDAYLAALTSTGDSSAVQSVIQGLQKNSQLPEPQGPLLLARAHLAAGNSQAAGAIYDDLTKRFPQDAEVMSAAVVFALPRDVPRAIALARSASSAQPQDRRLARQLAIALGATGEQTDFAEATRLLNSTENQLPAEEADQRIYADLLVKRPERALRKQGIEILANLVARKSSVSSQERLQLAQLYVADGQPQAALAQLTELLDRSSLVVPDHLATFVNLVLEHFDVATPAQRESAMEALKTLEKLNSDDWRSFALDLRLQAKQSGEEPDWAQRVAQPIVRDRVASLLPMAVNAQEKAALFANAAQLCSELGDAALAEEFYRKSAEQTASGKLALAGYLAEIGGEAKLDEAMELAQSVAGELGDAQAARALCTVMTVGGVDETQAQRGEAWLAPILEQNPSDVALQFAWGSYCLMRGDQERAISVLNEVLKQAPENVLARNNLAYLLAGSGQAAESLRQVDLAIASSGASTSFLDTRGLALLENQDAAGACAVFEELVAAVPDDALFRLHLAAAQLAAGRTSEAEASLRAAEAMKLEEAKLPALDRQRLASLRSAVGEKEATP